MISSDVERSLSAGRSEIVTTCRMGYTAITANTVRARYVRNRRRKRLEFID
jgi:hypothetical protein